MQSMVINMKLVTCNIRRDCEPGTRNSFEHRKPYLREKILKEDVDLIGFQEVLPHVAEWLQEALPDFTVLSCGRGPQYEDESAAIAFRKKRFNLLGYRTFWLSDTGEIPGSRYEDQSVYPRVCSAASFQIRETSRCFTLFNTHLDHEWESARIKGMKKILAAMADNPHPVLLTGDLNTFPGSGVPELIRSGPLPLVDVTERAGATFHGYGAAAEKLDYVFVGQEFVCKALSKWTECHDGVYLSDHYPLCAELEWKL